MKGLLTVVGLGPGDPRYLTPAASEALASATDLVGYGPYVDRVPERPGQRRHSSDNRVELDRARFALDLAAKGAHVAVVSGGDPGVFAMAAAVFEAVESGDPEWRSLDIRVEPGITAMLAAAARVGAPLGGDFCAMSLSDNLKPWEVVEARLRAALTADFVVALYNPISSARPWQLGAAFKIVSEMRGPDTPVILARAVMRPDERISDSAALRGGSLHGRHVDDRDHRRDDHAADRAAGGRGALRLHAAVLRGAAVKTFEPIKSGLGARNLLDATGLVRSCHDDDRQAESPCGRDLRIGRSTTGIFGHDHVDALALHQCALGGFVEGRAVADGDHVRHRQRIADGLDGAHEIGVLRRSGEGREFEPTHGEEDAAGRLPQRMNSLCHGSHVDPAVAILRLPRRAAQGEQRHAGLRAGLGRVAGHHGREGMRGVDHRLDPLLRQEAGKPLHAAEAADAGRDRQRARVAGAAGHGQKRFEVGAAGQKRRERGGFRGAAQNEDAHGSFFSEFRG